MSHIYKSGLIILLVMSLFIGCEEDDPIIEIPPPLTGEYTLTEMVIHINATTLRDTTLTFLHLQNGLDSIVIPAGTALLTSSTTYTDQDSVPIGGTVTLNADGSATLAGLLPVNWGTGCQPIVLISDLGSDGMWSADTSTGVFDLDLVVDLLDINGTFILSGNELEVHYEALLGNDEHLVSKVEYLGAVVSVSPTCLPVSTVTERVLTLEFN